MEGLNEKNNRDDIEVIDVGNGDNGVEVERENKEEIEAKMTDWAYKVMDWLKIAVEAGAWSEIVGHMDDIIQAFIVLVKPEHRGIVVETLRVIVEGMKREIYS